MEDKKEEQQPDFSYTERIDNDDPVEPGCQSNNINSNPAEEDVNSTKEISIPLRNDQNQFAQKTVDACIANSTPISEDPFLVSTESTEDTQEISAVPSEDPFLVNTEPADNAQEISTLPSEDPFLVETQLSDNTHEISYPQSKVTFPDETNSTPINQYSSGYIKENPVSTKVEPKRTTDESSIDNRNKTQLIKPLSNNLYIDKTKKEIAITQLPSLTTILNKANYDKIKGYTKTKTIVKYSSLILLSCVTYILITILKVF